jgi:pilus assembly protein FimV
MKFRIILVLLVLFAPTVVNALGLGKLELQSALNQPFKARVELLSATADALDSLKVSLADLEAFERAGIQRTFLLTNLRFRVEETEKGPDYIKIYSSETIREPFLNFLLEINWSKGRLFREYTVLLDPPMYTVPGSKKKAVLHPRTPIVEIDSDDHHVVYDLDYKPESKTRVSQSTPVTPSYEPPSSYAASPTISYAGSGDYGPAVTGDTLSSIAEARPDSSVSIQQMMLAILNANPEAFIENNINGLKRGAILQIPDATELDSLNQSDALAQVISQHALWDEYKGHIASSVSQQADCGAACTGVGEEPGDVEQEPTVTDVGDEGEAELRLISETDQGSGIDQSTAGASGVDVDALNNELALANESIEALFLENAELKDKLTETEGIIDDLKRLIVLKEDELAAMQEQIMIATAEQASAEAITDETIAEEEMEEELVEEVEEEFVEEEMEAEAAASEDEMIEEVIVTDDEGMGALSGFIDLGMGMLEKAKANLMIIGGVIGGLLLLVFLMIFVSKRRGEKATVDEWPTEDFPDFGEEPESESATVVPGSEDETILPGDDSADEASAEEEKTVFVGADANDAEADSDAFEVPETKVDVSPEGAQETPEEVPETTVDVSPEGAPEIPEDDSMEEVNAFLAYEHFDEAESLVRNALEKEPDNLYFHDKLLEVFYSAGNKKSYEDAARVVHEKTGGEGEYWDGAVARWQELSPNRALFETPVAGEDEVETPDTSGGGVLNIAEDDDGAEVSDIDFNIGGEESEEQTLDVTSADSVPEATESSENLDLETPIESDLSAGESDELLDNTLEMSPGDIEKTQQAGESAAEEILDVTAAIDLEEELGESSEEEILDISSSGESSESEGLDLSLDEVSLDLDTGDTSGEAGEDLLDISVTGDSEDSDELDMSSDDESGDKEDSLDVTSAINFESEGEDDLLDVTKSASEDENADKGTGTDDEIDLDLSSESPEISLEDGLVDDTAGETDTLVEIDDSVSSDSGGLDFDLDNDGGDAEESIELVLDTPEPEIELDDGTIDMESTVEMPPASVERLSLADDDDEEDHTLLVPKSSDINEQSEDEEMASQLDLAKAYIELGDNENAKTILDEIMEQGNENYRKQAEELIGQIK